MNGRTASYSANLLNQYEQREVPGAIDVRDTAPTPGGKDFLAPSFIGLAGPG
ncbi:MAG: hypothetical protein Q8M02_08095 [Candidatus Didemnitutus sp.]|nr:hypothetical protein [Candidatus Didemnitutus sp.]